jgi:hypothetical protein
LVQSPEDGDQGSAIRGVTVAESGGGAWQRVAFAIFLFLLFGGLLGGVVHKVGYGNLWFEFDHPAQQNQLNPQSGDARTWQQNYDAPASSSDGNLGGASSAGEHPGCWYVSNC